MYENNDCLAMRAGLEQKYPDNLAQRQQPVSVHVLGLEGEAGPEDVYENSLESRFEDRNNTEMSRFTFSPEDSRSYYDTTSNRTWYDLALLPKEANAVLKEGKIYLSKQNTKIAYTIMTAQGVVTVLSHLDAPIRFAMDHLIPLKQEILALTTVAGHTRAFPNITHYYSIDCVNDTLATPAREREALSSVSKVYRAEVTDGHVGLIYRRGVPEFIGPGKHILFEPDERFERYEQVSSRLITHGSIKVIRVRDEELVCIKDAYKGGDFRLLSTGTHIIKSPTAKLYPVINAYSQEMVIRTSLENVMPDPLDARQRPTPPPAGPAPASASKDKGKEEKKPSIKATADERIIFEKIPKGKQGVAYDDKGNIQIFPQGMWYIPAQWKFYNRISDKKAILNLELENLISQDGIRCQVTAAVEFKIKSIQEGITEYGPNNIQVAILDAAKNAVINQVKKYTVFLRNYKAENSHVEAKQEARDVAVGPEAIMVAEMNEALSAIEIKNVSFTITPSSPEVVAALDRAKAKEIEQASLLAQADRELEFQLRQLHNLRCLIQSKKAIIAELRGDAPVSALPRQANQAAMFQPAPQEGNLQAQAAAARQPAVGPADELQEGPR